MGHGRLQDQLPGPRSRARRRAGRPRVSRATKADQAAAIAAARAAAAAGGWPDAAMCSLAQKKTIWAWTVATFFGAGFGKPGPGTWGSAAAVLLWTAAALLLKLSATSLLGLTLAGIVLAVALGVP